MCTILLIQNISTFARFFYLFYMKIAVLDNHDSFVYNLVHYLKSVDNSLVLDVYKNDEISVEEIGLYDKILLSPGPGLPKNAGIMPNVLEKYASSKSILGVCLGHQAICEHFGGHLVNLKKPLHGIASEIHILQHKGIFQDIPDRIKVGHYHSWVAELQPSCELLVTAIDASGNIMGVCHPIYNVQGVQFHPESILTDFGMEMIKNWVFSK